MTRFYHRILAVDLDGTILEWGRKEQAQWNEGKLAYFGKLKEGVREALYYFRQRGYKIIIHSCRFTPTVYERGGTLEEAIVRVEKFLTEEKIPYDEFWFKPGKPVADYYIDDKGIRFKSWSQVVDEILNDSVIETPEECKYEGD